MAIAIDPRQSFWYVLKCDRELPPEKQTRWKFRGLTVSETLRLQALAETNELGRVKSMEPLVVGTLQMALEAVENFVDPEGQPVELDREGDLVAPRFIERLTVEWAVELSEAVLDRSKVTETDSD